MNISPLQFITPFRRSAVPTTMRQWPVIPAHFERALTKLLRSKEAVELYRKWQARIPDFRLCFLGKAKTAAELRQAEGVKNTLAKLAKALTISAKTPISAHLIPLDSANGRRKIISQLELMGRKVFLPRHQYSRADWQAKLAQKDALLIMAFNGRQPAGVVFGYHDQEYGEDVFFVDVLAVASDLQGKGLGSRLLKTFCALTTELAFTRVLLFSPLVEFYQRLGFTEISNHALALDLTEGLYVIDHTAGQELMGQTQPRCEAFLSELFEPTWSNRFPPLPLGSEPVNPRINGLGDLLRFLNWKKAVSWPESPLYAASIEIAFVAVDEAIPFLHETELVRCVGKYFGELEIVPAGNGYAVLHAGQTIGLIKVEIMDGNFTVFYRGRISPNTKETRVIIRGDRLISVFDLDFSDLYFLLRGFYFWQLVQSRLGPAQAQEILVNFARTLRGENQLIALNTFLYAVNVLADSSDLDVFLKAVFNAPTHDSGFAIMLEFTREALCLNNGRQKLMIAVTFMNSLLGVEGALMRQATQVWATALTDTSQELRLENLNVYAISAVMGLAEVGASPEELEGIFSRVLSMPDCVKVMWALGTVPLIYQRAGLPACVAFVADLDNNQFPGLTGIWQQHRPWVSVVKEAMANFYAVEPQAAGIVIELLTIWQDDPELAGRYFELASREKPGAEAVLLLKNDLGLRQDKRVREQLLQIALAGYQMAIDMFEMPAVLIKLFQKNCPNNPYLRLVGVRNAICLAESAVDLFENTEPDELEKRIQGLVSSNEEATRYVISQLAAHLGLKTIPGHWPAYTLDGFVHSTQRLLRARQDHWDKLDSNVDFLMKQVGKHGSIRGFYRHNRLAQGTITALKREGYDVDHLVFGNRKLLTATGEISGVQDLTRPWTRIAEVASHLFPEYFVRALRSDFHKLSDPTQAVTWSLAWLSIVRNELERVQGDGGKRLRRKEELKDLLDGLEWQLEKGVYFQGGTIESRKGLKNIPEFFYDNRRLSCCIFMPDGSISNEIPLVVMDPQTPTVEFWVSDQPEFMGVAIEYAGARRDLLLDTFEFGESLLSALGRNPTFKFVLDSLVKDALLSRAARLLIFDCKYGHPLDFVNYVRDLSTRKKYRDIIQFDPACHFELADPDCLALRNSRSSFQTHYTDAFRTANYKRRPMKGEIPVFVVDLEKYVAI